MKNETKIGCVFEVAAKGRILFYFIKRVTLLLHGVQQISIKLLERSVNAACVLQALPTWAAVAFPNSSLRLLHFIGEGKVGESNWHQQ